MASSITVPTSFPGEFEYLCGKMGLTWLEKQRLKDDVRRDFATVGAWVIETAEVYRFCDDTWGYVPTPELCEGYLASKHWWPADPGIFQTVGVMLLARLCAQVAGVIPGDPGTAPPAADPA